jgi:uncharacterized membrane protein YgaE (UPF0421/DUF939 family)
VPGWEEAVGNAESSKWGETLPRKPRLNKPALQTPKPPEPLAQRLEHGLQIGLRASLASLLAALAAFRLGMDYPIYAVIAAIVVTDSSPEVTRRLGLTRLAGTLVGAFWGGLIGTFLGNSPWVMAAGVLLAILFCNLIGMSQAQRITGYITGIVILFHGDSPWAYAKDRFVETALGLLFAILVGLGMEILIKKRGQS